MPLARATTPAARKVLVAIPAILMLLLAGCTTAPDDGNGDDNQTNGEDDGDAPDDDNGNGTDGNGTIVIRETLDQGAYGQGAEDPEERVIASDAEWGTFWQDHAERSTGAGAAATPPEVDFDTQFVLFAYAGLRNTGGYTIDIREVRAADGGYTAFVTELQPSGDCPTTEALTYPFHLVRVDRADRDTGGTPEVTFEHRTQLYGC